MSGYHDQILRRMCVLIASPPIGINLDARQAKPGLKSISKNDMKKHKSEYYVLAWNERYNKEDDRFFDTIEEANAWRPFGDNAIYTIVRDGEDGDQECSTDGGETWF